MLKGLKNFFQQLRNQDKIKSFEINNQNFSLNQQNTKIFVDYYCYCQYIKPLNAIIRTEGFNKNFKKRNAVMILTDLKTGTICKKFCIYT